MQIIQNGFMNIKAKSLGCPSKNEEKTGRSRPKPYNGKQAKIIFVSVSRTNEEVIRLYGKRWDIEAKCASNTIQKK